MSAAMARRGGCVAALAVSALLVPGVSAACSFCAYGRGDANIAYLATAAGMGTLPIAFGVGLAFWLRKKSRAAGLEREDVAPDDASDTTTT